MNTIINLIHTTSGVTNNAIPVKLNYVLAVNANEMQSADFFGVIKLNYYVYLSSEIMLKSDGF